jgi:SAM-dependent methyltransferase
VTAPEPAGAATFRAPADAYERLMGRYSNGLAGDLVRAAGVRHGGRALDVGCGPGALTAALAGVLGAGAVAAVDPSPSFVAACAARVPGADVRLGAAEALPFADRAFDAVLSQLALNFMTDAPGAVREMRRVARPGAVVAACVWDYADGMTLLRAFWDAALEADPDGAPAHDEGRVMRWCSPAELERLWSGAGLRDVRGGELHATARYDGFGDLWSAFEAGLGPSGAYAAALPATTRAALRAALERRIGRPAGPFTLTARAWLVTGRVSSG